MEQYEIGLIINPVAGMGGSVGLKGTDHMVAEAIRRGAVPRANDRTRVALEELLPLREQLTVFTYAGKMGGDLATEMGFSVSLLPSPIAAETSDTDTVTLARQLREQGVSLLLFAGGDGTARDIYRAVETAQPAIGIPAGVKIHSPVYAKSPRAAGRLALHFLTGKVTECKEQEVLDIDEERYRQEQISTRLYGYLSVPAEKLLTQNRKSGTPEREANAIYSIAHKIINEMEPDTYYLIGAGTTTRGIMEILGLKNTLIGVDLLYNKEVVANDLYGDRILEYISGKKAKLVVTVTGGQGFLFGRGNQQITPAVIRAIGKANILIIGTKEKLSALIGQPLLVDTGDDALDAELSGYYRVISGYYETIVCKVATPV